MRFLRRNRLALWESIRGCDRAHPFGLRHLRLRRLRRVDSRTTLQRSGSRRGTRARRFRRDRASRAYGERTSVARARAPHARPSASRRMVATSPSSEAPMAAKPSLSCSRHFGQRISPRTIVFLLRVRYTNHTGLSCDPLSRISWRAGGSYRSIATFPPRRSGSRFRQRIWSPSRPTRWTISPRTFSPRSAPPRLKFR